MNNVIWILSLFALGVIYLIINNITRSLTANIYVFVSYLYIILALIMSSITWMVLDDNENIINSIFGDTWSFIGLIVISLISLFTIMFTSRDRIIIKHASWVLFTICVGVFSFVSYKYNQMTGNLTLSCIELILIVSALSYIAYSQPLETFAGWHTPLMAILFCLIIVEAGDYLFFSKSNDFLTRSKIYSWIGIFVFSGFILYDTQNLIEKANAIVLSCTSKNQLKCTDYPSTSLSIFLDIANLFVDMSVVNS